MFQRESEGDRWRLREKKRNKLEITIPEIISTHNAACTSGKM